MTGTARTGRAATRAVRYGLPAAIVAAAVVVVAVRGPGDIVALEVAAVLVGAGLSVYLLNWLYRFGVAGDSDREREEAARRYFDEHGRWPDEQASDAPASAGRRRQA
jgi:hypothetical protein